MEPIWIKEGKFIALKEEQIKELDDDLRIAYFQAKQKDQIEKLETALKEETEKNVDEIKGLRDSIAKDQKQVMDILAGQVEEIAKMKAGSLEQETKTLTFVGQISKALKDSEFSLETLRKGVLTELELKVDQTAADIDSGTDFAQMLPGVGQEPTRNILMKSLFRSATTTSEYVKYNDQETVVRDAKNVAGCAASTHLSKITWKVRSLQITKVRDFVSICLDMLEDYAFVSSEINNLVTVDVALKVDSGLLLGTAVHPELNSVDAVATTFAAGSYALSVTLAQVIDLIVVAGAQIVALGQENAFIPNVVLMNIVDATLMGLEKLTDGQYLIPNWITSDGKTVSGMRVITNPLIPADEMYIGDFTKGTVFIRRGSRVEFSFENRENFEEEMVTVKAYERLNLLIRNNDLAAFTHVPSIAAAVTAITAP